MELTNVYLSMSDIDLEEFESLSDSEQVFDKIDVLEKKENIFSDIDKFGNVLIFLLSKKVNNDSDSNIFYKAIMGDRMVNNTIDNQHVSLKSINKITLIKIIKEFDNLDKDECYDMFNLEELSDKEIYPNIWSENKDELFDEFWDILIGLVNFYRETLTNSKNILVYVC